MVDKIGHIKNPLTVIAIFAGIAEISGTAVLPFLAPQNQSIYIWFLMLFPTILIGLFFYTLNCNHKTLYAPSDYKDEDNFLKSMRQASLAEKQNKISAEVSEVERDEIKNAQLIKLDNEVGNGIEVRLNDNDLENTDDCDTNLIREQEAAYDVKGPQPTVHNNYFPRTITERDLTKDIRDKIIKAQDFSIVKLSNRLNLNFQKDVNYTSNDGASIIFDALAVTSSGVHAVEVKYSKSGSLTLDIITKVLQNAKIISEDVRRDNPLDFTLHFVIVTGIQMVRTYEIERQITAQARAVNIKTVTHIYSMNDLIEEFGTNI